ncbi:MAG: alpha-glucosidase C-terminal domain-containing protein, partial [Halomonas sp.]
VDGDIDLVDVGEDLLGFVRETGEERILCVFNLTGQARETRLQLAVDAPLEGHGFSAECDGETLQLPPYQAAYYRLA